MSKRIKATRIALLPILLLLAGLSSFAQERAREGSSSQHKNPVERVEVPDTEEERRFIEEHSLTNPSFRRQQSERAGAEALPEVQDSRQVRMIYLVPSDKSIRADYQSAIASAISELQRFYREQLGGYTFSLHSPIVEVYQTPHPTSFYSTGSNSYPGGFWQSVLGDGFALTGGGFNDPNNRWIFYMDADQACGQYTGGTSGVVLVPANDLRGLTAQQNRPVCSNELPDPYGLNRWIGGLGHELGHAFNLPHPPGCDQGHCTDGDYAARSLMYLGYIFYPNTYLLDANKASLLNNGFFSILTTSYVISGQVMLNNYGLAGATVFLSGTQARTTTTDASGRYSFADVPGGGNFIITPALPNYSFSPQSQTINNLSADAVFSFTARLNTGVPILISEENSTRALALDSVLSLREPFQATSQYSWGSERQTRIMLFATNFELLPGVPLSAITAEAEDSAHRIYSLPVEYVGKAAGFSWLNCIVVRLSPEMGDIGDVLVRISYQGVSSNRARVGIGHVGGGLPDDAGATPTPGRPPQ